MQTASPEMGVMFLEDQWQPLEQVADEITGFFQAATRSLDIAIYDAALTGQAADMVRASLQQAAGRGVAIRIAYYAGPHQSPTISPCSPATTASFLSSLDLPIRPIHGFQALMHDKYVVRDVGTPAAAVWSGTANWTVDSWTRQENVIFYLPSPELAGLYHIDFEELWNVANVDNTGARAGGRATLTFVGEAVPTRVWFSPGSGMAMAHAVGDAIAEAQRRVVLASPVLTDGPILGALRDVVNSGQVLVRGVYDRTQMDEVCAQWKDNPRAAWKIDAFNTIAQAAGLAGKRSTPYTPSSLHDFMHAKVIIVDDVVFSGSYNFSHSGEENAENLLHFDSPPLAERCAAYVDRLIERYGGPAKL